MVGFALAHSAWIFPLGLSAVACLIWVPIALAFVAFAFSKGHKPSRREWIQIGILAAPLAILYLVPANT